MTLFIVIVNICMLVGCSGLKQHNSPSPTKTLTSKTTKAQALLLFAQAGCLMLSKFAFESTGLLLLLRRCCIYFSHINIVAFLYTHICSNNDNCYMLC